MKLLLVKVLALTLVITSNSKDALAQVKNQDEHVAALRGSVVSSYDMIYESMETHMFCVHI